MTDPPRDTRERFDAQGKDALVALLHDLGEVRRGIETGATTQRVDVWFHPDAAHRRERLSRGLLGRMVDEDCDLELFRNTPSMTEVRECVRKLWNLHHVREREREAARRVPTRELPFPRVWVVSTGRPEGALGGFSMRGEAPWPDGVYVTSREVGLGVVVLAELDATRDTLALRLLGRGAVLERACAELVALPDDAWERRLVEVLVRWRTMIPADPAQRTPDEEDFMHATRDAFEALRSTWIDHGRTEGLSQGLSQGLSPLVRLFARKLGRPLADAERSALATRLLTLGADRLGDVALDLDGRSLAAWLADPDAR